MESGALSQELPAPIAPAETSVESRAAADAESSAEQGRLARNLAALAGGQMVTWTMTLAWTLVVPRILGPASIGIIVTAWSVTGILGIALGFGTKNYLVRAIVVDRESAPALVATGTSLRILLAPAFMGAVILYAAVAGYGHEQKLVLYLAGGATLLTLLSEPMQAAFQAVERMEYLAVSDVINKSVQGLLGIVLAVLGFGAVGFAGCWLVMSGVVLILNAFWLRPHVRLGLRTSGRQLAVMARESVAYWAFGVFFMIYLWIDTAMLSLMTNSTVVGWYGVPTKIFQTMMFVPVMLSTAWLPRLVSAFERDPAKLGPASRTPVELSLVLGLPIGAALATVAGPLIHFVYGASYGPAVPVTAILGACVAPMYLNIVLSQVLIAAKRQIVWTWLMAGATVVNPVINLMLIPLTQNRYGNGAIGAAASLFLTELLIVAAGFWLAGRSVISRAGLRRIGQVGLASGAMWGTAIMLRHLGAVPSLAAAAAVFVVAVAAMGVATREEIAFVRERTARAGRAARVGAVAAFSRLRAFGLARPWRSEP